MAQPMAVANNKSANMLSYFAGAFAHASTNAEREDEANAALALNANENSLSQEEIRELNAVATSGGRINVGPPGLPRPVPAYNPGAFRPGQTRGTINSPRFVGHKPRENPNLRRAVKAQRIANLAILRHQRPKKGTPGYVVLRRKKPKNLCTISGAKSRAKAMGVKMGTSATNVWKLHAVDMALVDLAAKYTRGRGAKIVQQEDMDSAIRDMQECVNKGGPIPKLRKKRRRRY
jgi:hypothetical protein